MTEITMVYPYNIAQIWKETEPLLMPSLSIYGTHRPEDVYKSLMIGAAHLWVEWNNKVESCLVTEFVAYPRGMALRIWLIGKHKDANTDWETYRPFIVEFMKQNQCRDIEIYSREGFQKLFSEAQKKGVILRARLEHIEQPLLKKTG